MKLSTEIKPRTDGTVRVQGEDGQTYVFKGEELECEIADEATVKRLLGLGTFFPASDADHEAALALMDDDIEDDGGEDDQADPDAPPIETGVTATPAPAPAAAEAAAAPAASPAPAVEPTRRTRKAG